MWRKAIAPLARRAAAPHYAQRAPARFAARAMSTNPDVDNNAFLNEFSDEEAQRILKRSEEIRAKHFAAAESFPAVR